MAAAKRRRANKLAAVFADVNEQRDRVVLLALLIVASLARSHRTRILVLSAISYWHANVLYANGVIDTATRVSSNQVLEAET